MLSNCPFVSAVLLLSVWPAATAAESSKSRTGPVPKAWDEAELAGWATPVAGLNVPPGHISSTEYYSVPVENYRSYPVYMPGREPEGYWEMLQRLGPQPLIDAQSLHTEADWLKAGRRVFEEATLPQFTTFNPELIAQVRNRQFMESQGIDAFPDGTVDFLRWMPVKKGVALTGSNCSACHVLHRKDGSHVLGAPGKSEVTRTAQDRFRPLSPRYLQAPNRVLAGAPPFFMGDSALGDWLYQAYGVPWLRDDPNIRLKGVTAVELASLIAAYRASGGVIRWNGSLLYPAKIPDLIGIQDRKYFDHTATHLHRGPGDLMRYAAQVSFAETTDFGSHHMLAAGTRRVQGRLPDEALYALALYIYSLKPPRNPNPSDHNARAGQKIFKREGCNTCHTPPLYTNNKVTPATGFAVPANLPRGIDVVPLSVGTDPNLALATRKGTGYYKIPSLKGLWYRGHYLHDGSAATLEEMFDPDRLKQTHVPGGYMPLGLKANAIPGHEFGLNLTRSERAQLIAFLRTL